MSISNESKNLNIRDVLLTSIGVAVVYGFIEWLVIDKLGLGLRQEEACRTILAIFLLYGLFGLALGVISAVLLCLSRFSHIAVSLPLSVLLALEIFKEKQNPLIMAAAFAIGWLCLVLFRYIFTKCPYLWRPRLWWILQGFIITVTLTLTSFKTPNTQNFIIAIVFAGVAALLLIWHLIQGRINLWRCVLAIFMVLITCGFLGFRMPVVKPVTEADLDRTSVLLITIDTLRADHVGVYGYANARTPNLDGLAKRGVFFHQVVTPQRFTGPSHASILTGLLPEKHGVLQNLERMSQSVPTIADLLSTKGYVTASFVSSYTTLDSACGLPSHFQAYYDNIDDIPWFPPKAYNILLFKYSKKILKDLIGISFDPIYKTGAKTTDLAIKWLGRNNKYPFFIWVHLFDPHLPYIPPKEYLTEEAKNYKGPVSGDWYFQSAFEQSQIIATPEDFKQMIALYDAEVSYADHQVGRIVDAAQRNVQNGRLLTIVTADHGESMGEHSLYWCRDLYDPTLLVPLIFVPPDNVIETPLVIENQVRTIDIAPTILDLIGIEPMKNIDGRSLSGLIKSGLPFQVSAKSGLYPSPKQYSRAAASIRHKGWKLIERSAGWQACEGPWLKESIELYNLREDPSEENNLASISLDELKELKEELGRYKHLSGSQELSLTPEMEERLRSLGYLR
jgi:arylsulfatase A-like enzyme